MEICSGCDHDSLQHVPNRPNWYRVYLGVVIPTQTWRLLTPHSMNAPSLSPNTLLWWERWGSVIIGALLPFTCPRSTGSLSGLCCSLTGWLIKLLGVKDKRVKRFNDKERHCMLKLPLRYWPDVGFCQEHWRGLWSKWTHDWHTVCSSPHTRLTLAGGCVEVGGVKL